jgi:hypothetical protein
VAEVVMTGMIYTDRTTFLLQPWCQPTERVERNGVATAT